MKTFVHFFPFGTLRGTVFNYSLATIYGTIAAFRLIRELFRDRKSFFNVKHRPQPPQCLFDKNLGEHHFITINNLKLHYVSNGDNNRPLMLFLHGFPEVWYSWRHQLPEFGKQYHAVALDMRGYGDSDKPKGVHNYSPDILINDIKEVITALGNKNQCILVAHDWGGLLAWSTAQLYPQLVQKLIILNAPTITSWLKLIESDWKQFFMSWYVFFFNLPLLPELRMRANDLIFFNLLWKKVATSDEIEAYKYYYARSDAASGPLNYYRALQRGYGLQLLEKLETKRVVMPTLVIWGKNDMALSLSLAEESCKSCDDYVIKVIDDCSHWTQTDKPVLVNQYINEFLNIKS